MTGFPSAKEWRRSPSSRYIRPASPPSCFRVNWRRTWWNPSPATWRRCHGRVESDNVNLVRSDDQAMGEAIAKARATLPRALATIAEGRGEGFTVKFPVEDNGEVEHFWLSNTVIHHDHFSGTQEEEAATVTNVQAGQPFSVPASEISDWMYVRGGKMHGNFTLRAMLPSMPPEQRARYEPHLAPEDDI
ncbi:MAG: DUF2314 domain-containing protein [Verrucomicrobiales bacterium]